MWPLYYTRGTQYIPFNTELHPARQHNPVSNVSDYRICTTILLPSSDSRRVIVSYKRKYVHEVLVTHIVKLAQEKSVVR